jgi:DegV family protein with EDD domain
MTNHKVALITDSTCDIPDDLLEKYDIAVVPSLVIWGDEVLRDRVDIEPEEFYERLERDPVFPTTSQPTPQDFCSGYRQATQKGIQEIVVITVSSAMSGTIEAAKQAAEMIDVPVHVIDSKGPTMTVGWQVLAAARAREAGGDAQAMVKAADKARESLVQFVCLDTLEYLHKGGRIGGATKFIGTMLNIKPLITIDHQTGLVEPGKRVRTRTRALEALHDEFFSHLDTRKTMRIAVLHGGALKEAETLAERIQREFAPAELLMNITGPVLGVHTGPRAIALVGYTED